MAGRENAATFTSVFFDFLPYGFRRLVLAGLGQSKDVMKPEIM